MPASEIIRTVELTKVYAGTDFAAVNQLDLSVHAGEIFGLLGPNGAGKTTTAGMLTTRVIPTSGAAHVGAIDVVAHPALAKQLIGIVSQQNTLDRQLTVWENLYFHGRLFGISPAESRSTADQLLEQFQLTKWAKASVFALSGGMAQRLMVARMRVPGHRPDCHPGHHLRRFRFDRPQQIAALLLFCWLAQCAAADCTYAADRERLSICALRPGDMGAPLTDRRLLHDMRQYP